MVRQFLKPGITGWAQINGQRGEIKTLQQLQARVEHDIWYMENWNQWLDVRIIFMTMANMISGQKNAF
jgi:putative colanic acid biosynthesis UDP-glucose lipid carrier transferase